MKKILLALALAVLGTGIFSGCSKEEILTRYNQVVQAAGTLALTGETSLQGTKQTGVDDYTGRYSADYRDFTGIEHLFGGTSLHREAGDELRISCTLQITAGSAKIFWISGAEEAVILMETTGTHSETITLPAGSNDIGIDCAHFTGTVALQVE